MQTPIIRKIVLLLVLAMLIVLLGQAAPVKATAAIRYVAPGASCGGKTPCYATVQDALDAANTGDEIHVAAGTYTDVHSRPRNDTLTTGNVKQVVYIIKTVTIRGGYNTSFTTWDTAAYVSTLDAQQKGRGIYIVGNISPTIESLSITGGDATGLQGYDYYGQYDVGGGVYIYSATATLNNNRIFNNFAPYGGGGVFLGLSSSQLNDNTISNNNVNQGGAGIFIYKGSATLSGNWIASNTSGELGGGAYLFSTSATLSGNTIAGNTASLIAGGVDVASCNPTFNGNILAGNTAPRGGGMYIWYSFSIMTNNVIINNQASSAGSGLWIGGSTPQLLQTTIAHNTGGDGSGIFATDDGNSSPAFSSVTLTNTILVNQTVGITATTGSTVNVDGVLWHGNGANSGGAGSIPITHAYSGDPAFWVDGYHLTAKSAAIDKGVSDGVTTDIDGQARIGAPDLGADEYWPILFLPLIMRIP